jgi:hypothetical protein
MKNILLYWWSFLNTFWEGGREGGTVRLWAVMGGAFLYMALGRILFEDVDTLVIATGWRESLFILRLFRVPLPFLQALAYFLNGQALRYWLPPVVAIVVAMWVGGRYVQDIYELKKLQLGLCYLRAAMFGLDYPFLDIAAGRKQVKPGDVNLLDVIGGPGYISIQPGNIVLFERLREPASVLAAGVHFVPRREKLFEDIGSLDDQPGEVKEITAVSKDGIPVTVSNITFRYRLHASSRSGHVSRRKADNPYPFSVQAMRNMAYHRAVGLNGSLTPWPVVIEGVIKGVITGVVTSNQVDYLTAPKRQENDPRLDIAGRLKAKPVRESLKNLGAELLWCDIGHFGVPDPADLQRLETWGAKWKGSAAVNEAYGKAQRLAYQELARGEAQAELLVSILYALEDVDLAKNHPENLRKIIIARTAGVLEAMTDIGRMAIINDE